MAADGGTLEFFLRRPTRDLGATVIVDLMTVNATVALEKGNLAPVERLPNPQTGPWERFRLNFDYQTWGAPGQRYFACELGKVGALRIEALVHGPGADVALDEVSLWGYPKPKTVLDPTTPDPLNFNYVEAGKSSDPAEVDLLNLGPGAAFTVASTHTKWPQPEAFFVEPADGACDAQPFQIVGQVM